MQNITIINLQVPLIMYRFNTYVLITLNITAFIDPTNMAMPCYNLAESKYISKSMKRVDTFNESFFPACSFPVNN